MQAELPIYLKLLHHAIKHTFIIGSSPEMDQLEVLPDRRNGAVQALGKSPRELRIYRFQEACIRELPRAVPS